MLKICCYSAIGRQLSICLFSFPVWWYSFPLRHKIDSTMIQRIQTVYLAIAAILSMLIVFLKLTLASVGEYELTAVSVNLIKDGVLETAMSSFAIAGAIMFGLFLTVYGIMQYKNRKFQIKLVQGALLVQWIVVGLVFFYADKMGVLAESYSVSYSPSLAILLVNVVLYFLAIRGIKKDDALVRSADRLR